MSLFALASGVLIADPVRREGAKGPFTTASIRVSAGEGEAALVSLIAFGAEAERLLEYSNATPLAVSGRAKLTAWTGRDGEEKHGLSIVAEQIASTKPRRTQQSALDARSGGTRPSASRQPYPHHHLAAQPAGDPRPFDDRLDDIGVGP